MRRKKIHEQMIANLYSTLHECKNCEGCDYYKIEPCNNFGPNAYCYYSENIRVGKLYSTEEGVEPTECKIMDKGPDEINSSNECEWKVIDEN